MDTVTSKIQNLWTNSFKEQFKLADYMGIRKTLKNDVVECVFYQTKPEVDIKIATVLINNWIKEHDKIKFASGDFWLNREQIEMFFDFGNRVDKLLESEMDNG